MIRVFVHSAGSAPCGGTAFVAPVDLFNQIRSRPIVSVDAANGIVRLLDAAPGQIPCSTCQAIVGEDDLVIAPYFGGAAASGDIARYLYTDLRNDHERRQQGRPPGRERRHRVDFANRTGPTLVGVHDIAEATGVHRNTIREMCEAGDMEHAFRVGTRRVWRIPYAIARAFVHRLTGADRDAQRPNSQPLRRESRQDATDSPTSHGTV